MRVYWELAKLGFRRYAAYRGATLAGVFTNTIFGFMLAYITLALFEANPNINGYDARDGVTYMWIAQGALAVIYVWSSTRSAEIAQRMRSGDVALDLQRPVDFQGYWLAQDLGRGLYHAIFRGIPPVLFGALVFQLRWPAHPLTWLWFALSLTLASCVSFALRFLMNLSAFWILDYRGLFALAMFAWPFLAGSYIPLAVFPDGVYRVLLLLPFAGLLQAPAAVFLEKPGLAQTLLLQAGWAAVLLLLGRLVLTRACRQVVIQGG